MLDKEKTFERNRLISLRAAIEARMGDKHLEVGDMFMVACEPCGSMDGFYTASGMAEMSGDWMRVVKVEQNRNGRHYYSAMHCALDGGFIVGGDLYKNGWAWSHYQMGAIKRHGQGIVVLSGLGSNHLKEQNLAPAPLAGTLKQ